MILWLSATATLAIVGFLGFLGFTVWGSRWGATRRERVLAMPGDDYLQDGAARRVVMTRAVSVHAPVDVVWAWIAQLGRGAGWYSIDWLDNGGRVSARHIVSWIPDPRLGDATAIGYLRHLAPKREIVWWMSGERFLGTWVRMVVSFQLTSETGGATRLVCRVSGDGAGIAARAVLWLFRFIDSIMARRQLLGIKERAERYASRPSNPDQPETGARDQFQLYEVVYASGERAGVQGKEQAARWRADAMRGPGI